MLMYSLQGLDKKKKKEKKKEKKEKKRKEKREKKTLPHQRTDPIRDKQKWKCCETVEVSCGISVHPKELHKFQTCL